MGTARQFGRFGGCREPRYPYACVGVGGAGGGIGDGISDGGGSAGTVGGAGASAVLVDETIFVLLMQNNLFKAWPVTLVSRWISLFPIHGFRIACPSNVLAVLELRLNNRRMLIDRLPSFAELSPDARAKLKIETWLRRAREHRALRIYANIFYCGVIACRRRVGASGETRGGGDEIGISEIGRLRVS